MEGVASVMSLIYMYTADIAIDDISFSKNLTCISDERNAPPEIFEGIIFKVNFFKEYSNGKVFYWVSK